MTAIDLADGRVLELAVTGPEGGFPLVMHHGTPGSRTRFRVVEEAVHRKGLRLVTFSRPGYGASTRKAGRAVVDVASDVAAVLEHLGAERCVTLGWSGGGPHALAAAVGLPERIAAVAVVAGVGPYGREKDASGDGLDFLDGMGEDNIEEFGAALAGPRQLTEYLTPVAEALRTVTPDQLVQELSSLLPEVDRVVLEGEVGAQLAASFAEGLRNGAAGWIDDDLAFVRPWGFEPGEIAVPAFLWQGEIDLMVPLAHGRWLADRIPGVRAHLLAGEGHLSVFLSRIDEMLEELTGVLA